jgi:hypothetical protein
MRSILRSTIGVAENVRRGEEKREEEVVRLVVVLHVVGRKPRVPTKLQVRPSPAPGAYL